MKTVCSHCNQDYEVPDEYVGKNGKCAACGKTFPMKEYSACPKCHSLRAENIQPCPKCGYSSASEEKVSATMKLWNWIKHRNNHARAKKYPDERG
ncbi:MAG: hypothetical protein BWY31_04053 [Lentisphaerae bacterium ADurb.Bin242]|nr:MAG: hypothetical protein BWY31_04053 [Lentisphaerae bacterium ADurb.Bin242]